MSDSTTTTKRPKTKGRSVRLLFLLPAGISLLAGLDAALLLLGVPAPITTERLPQVHGMLMTLGFLATLISLERAVALGKFWGFVAPISFGIGGIALLSPAPLIVGKVLLLLGACWMVLNYFPLWRRQRDDAVLIQTLGAVLAIGASLLWLAGLPISALIPWLIAFIVLTIAGERLELARIQMGPHANRTMVALSSFVIIAVATTLLWPEVGAALLGVSMLALANWLLVHDVAHKTVRSTGAPRFIAWCMLAGYGWLLVAGLMWLLLGPVESGAGYDTLIHAAFLGFAMSMVMAHAPVIFPAVLRRPLPYHPLMYLPIILLNVSLVVRLWGGHVFNSVRAWEIGGIFNVISLLLFVLIALFSAVRGARMNQSIGRHS